jgi:DNA-directed RNA polymerase subunit N (RpoN/RPB10)
LGDIYDLYKALKMEKYTEAFGNIDLNIDPSILALITDIPIDMTDVFEKLHVDLDCCRARLVTQVEFTEYY